MRSTTPSQSASSELAASGILTIPALSAEPGLKHGFSTLELGSVHIKDGHESAGLANRRRLATALQLDPDRITAIGAVHGAQVVRAGDPQPWVDGVDGLVTDRPGLVLFATFADCYPIVAFDPRHHVAGLAHAGWRGTAAGIAGELVRVLGQEFGSRPEDLVAALGPGICGACYEVGPEVAEQFPAEALRRGRDGELLLDVGAANRLQLITEGVRADRIHASGLCTRETPELPSHRRDHDGRRFGAIVALA